MARVLLHRRPITESAIQHHLRNLHKPPRGRAFPRAPHDPGSMCNFCDIAWTYSLEESFFSISSASHVGTNGPNKRHEDVRGTDTSRSVSSTRSVTQPGTRIDIPTILRRANLTLFKLTSAETDCASETPDILWATFTKLFGGCMKAEWQDCRKIPNYRNFLCATRAAQPFVPTSPGQPGLVLRVPSIVSTPPDDGSGTLRVISCSLRGTRLKYIGDYTRRPLPNVHIQWNDLSIGVSTFRG